MMDILLSTPGFYLYVAFLAVALATAHWTRKPDLPARGHRATAPTTGRAPASRWQHVATSAGLPCEVPPCRTWPAGRPFPDLQDTLTASYAARVEQAMRAIRVVPSAGTGPTEQVAGWID